MTSIYERHDGENKERGGTKVGAYEENSDAKVEGQRGLPQGLI